MDFFFVHIALVWIELECIRLIRTPYTVQGPHCQLRIGNNRADERLYVCVCLCVSVLAIRYETPHQRPKIAAENLKT